jgi:predicted transcriptional regulator
MKQPCEHIVRNVLPAIRALIAKRLVVDSGLTQVEAARKLGITQAAVSFYLSSKRGKQVLSELSQTEKVHAAVTEVTAQLLAKECNSSVVLTRLCELCVALRSEMLNTTPYINEGV